MAKIIKATKIVNAKESLKDRLLKKESLKNSLLNKEDGNLSKKIDINAKKLYIANQVSQIQNNTNVLETDFSYGKKESYKILSKKLISEEINTPNSYAELLAIAGKPSKLSEAKNISNESLKKNNYDWIIKNNPNDWFILVDGKKYDSDIAREYRRKHFMSQMTQEKYESFALREACIGLYMN